MSAKGLYEPYQPGSSFEHEYLPSDAHDEEYAGVGDGGIYCRNCISGEGDPKWGKHEGETNSISWGELRHHYPHGTTCDNCYKPLVSERPHTHNECEIGRDCESWDPQEEADSYARSEDHKHTILQDMRTEGIDIDHKPSVPHLSEHQAADHDFGSQTDLDREKWDGEHWAAKYHQRKNDEASAASQINDLFHGSPEAEFMKGNTQGPTHYSKRTVAYGETKAPIQVDTLRDADCPVCGDSDSFDGDTCQVCGFVAPPKMFQDPDLDKARLLDLRANPATGAPNNTDPNLDPGAPIDPSQVGPDGQPLAGQDIEGQEAAQVQADSDDDGIVEGEVRGLQDYGADPNAPVDPNQVNPQGQVMVDPAAAEGRVLQGGEPFTQGPNAPVPAQPMDPGVAEADADESGAPVDDDGQPLAPEASPDPDEPGYPADGVGDLMCPACGFAADAAHPLSTSMDAAAPSNAGDGMQEGDVCPNCGQAQLMSTGEIQQMEQAEQQMQGI